MCICIRTLTRLLSVSQIPVFTFFIAILSWIIKDFSKETHMRKNCIKKSDIKCLDNIPVKISDEKVVNIRRIHKYCTGTAWAVIEQIMSKKKKEKWFCKVCCKQCKTSGKDILPSIGCDSCLDWYHTKCINMKAFTKSKYWMCRNCYRDAKTQQ